MNKLIALGIAAMLAVTAMPGIEASEARTEFSTYLPGAMGVTVVWCSADDHELTPTYDPPLDDPESIDGWLFSGEPECAYSDALNAVNEQTGAERNATGIGGAAWYLDTDEFGGTIETAAEDDVFADIYMRITIDFCSTEDGEEIPCPEVGSGEQFETTRAAYEGCGTAEGDIPEHTAHHWQSAPGEEYYLAWTWIPEVGVTEELDICFSSSGIVSATISPP